MASGITFRFSRTVVARNWDRAIELRRGEIGEEATSTVSHDYVEYRHPGTVMRTEKAFECFMTEIDHVFVANQAIPVGDDCERVAVNLRIDGRNGAIPFRAPGRGCRRTRR